MGVVAMLFFIAWGLWVNWEHGVAARIQVALTQGVISLVSTWLSAEFIQWVVMRWKGGGVQRVLGSGIVSYLVIYSLVATAHLLAGTPDLFETMIPGLLIGLVFCFSYSWRVAKQLSF